MIYFVFIILAVLFYLCGGKQGKKGLAYIIMMGLCLFLIFSLRSTSVGYDSGTYARLFYNSSFLSMKEIINSYTEPGYYILVKTVSFLSDNHQLLFVLQGLIVSVLISRFIYKYSSNYMLSFIMLIPMQYLGFFISAQRQAIAVCILLSGFDFVIKRKYILWFGCVIIACLFHNSAILGAPLILLVSKNNITNTERFLFLMLIPCVFATKKIILTLGLSWFYSEYTLYESEAGTLATMIMYLLIWIAFVLFRNHKNSALENFLERTLYVGVLLQIFVFLEPNIYRFAFYYQIFTILIIPLIVSGIKNYSIRVLAQCAILMIMLFLYFNFTYYSSGINPYTFFWEQNYN